MHGLYPFYLAVSRWVLPALAVLVALFWVAYFRAARPPKRVIARFTDGQGASYPVTVAEGFVGRGRRCDVALPDETVQKAHAVFYQKNGGWWIAPRRGDVTVNDVPADGPVPLMDGDVLTLGRTALTFVCNDPEQEDISSFTPPTGALPLVLLTVFQIVMGGQLCLRYWEDMPLMLPVCFGALIAGEWLYFLAGRWIPHFHMLMEIPVLYLTTLGLAVCACASPENLYKQLICALLGMAGYIGFTLLLRKESWCYALRFVVAGVTLAVLLFTAVFGTRIFGARNWLSIGSFSLQPSEFAKITFVFVGACGLYVTTQKPFNRWFFLGFAAAVLGSLVLMVDFGAVAIFFVALIIILLMRLTDVRLVGALVAAAVAAGVLVTVLYPYVASRFSAWTHVWEVADAGGYQQTRTLIAAASGGLLGVGGGNGYLSGIAAAETDLVFGIVSEEWGGLIALGAALCFVALGVLARRLAENTRSAFYAIGVCAAAGMMLFQAALNLFGSTDLLPLTGVTMMFVSRGGTSLIAAFWLMAYFKAAEVRPHGLETERRRYY